MDGGCNNQRGPLHALDRVHVLLHHRVHDALVEAVRGRDDHVLDGQRTGPSQRVQQVECGGLLGCLQVST